MACSNKAPCASRQCHMGRFLFKSRDLPEYPGYILPPTKGWLKDEGGLWHQGPCWRGSLSVSL